jgi:hypothetical protein
MNGLNPTAAKKLLHIQSYIQQHLKQRRIRSPTTLSLPRADDGCATSDTWTLLPKTAVAPFLKRIIIEHQRPMPIAELLNALMERKLSFVTTNHHHYLYTFLQLRKSLFVCFRCVGYWPADFPYAALGYVDPKVGQGMHDAPRVAASKSVKIADVLSRKSERTWASNWQAIRGRVANVEWALRKRIPAWTRKSNINLKLTITTDEGVITTEKWLLLTSARAARYARQVMLRMGRPMLGNEILEQFITLRIGLQSFTQRRSMADLLEYYRRKADFVHVKNKGYWPADQPIPPSGYDGRGEPS